MNSIQEFIFCPSCDDLISNNTCKCGHIIKCKKCSVIHPPVTSNDGDQTVICPTCSNGFETIINYLPDEWDANFDEKSITMVFENIPNRKIVVKTIIEDPTELLKGNMDISNVKVLTGEGLSNDFVLKIEKEYILALLVCFFPYGENTNSIEHFFTFVGNINCFKYEFVNTLDIEKMQRNRNILKYVTMYLSRMVRQRLATLMLNDLINTQNNGGLPNIDFSDDIPMYAASKDEIDKLEDSSIKYSDLKDKKDTSCPICFEDYEDDDKITFLECCKNTLHMKCIKKWLTESNHTCPICRKEFDKCDEKL